MDKNFIYYVLEEFSKSPNLFVRCTLSTSAVYVDVYVLDIDIRSNIDEFFSKHKNVAFVFDRIVPILVKNCYVTNFYHSSDSVHFTCDVPYEKV